MSSLLKSSSKISTYCRCDNCGVTMDQVQWTQCSLCHAFSLCSSCTTLHYSDLLEECRTRHEQYHQEILIKAPITDDCWKTVLLDEAEKYLDTQRQRSEQTKYDEIREAKKIVNEYEMYVVMQKLKQLRATSNDTELNELNRLIAEYHFRASQRTIRVLSLDGGGVRGYMPIKIITDFVSQQYGVSMDSDDLGEKTAFGKVQSRFTDRFDYFIGTSTGGLIAFCLAMNYNILDMKEIYAQSSKYFKRNVLGPLIYSKYDPSRIHQKIDEIINQIFEQHPSLSADNITLLDVHHFLNPKVTSNGRPSDTSIYGNQLEFGDDADLTKARDLHRVKREKVLLITAYNTTTSCITIFNTSYSKHWNYRIADVLKATMAAPTYFPPYEVWSWENQGGRHVKVGTPELYIDGGVYANDPELAALWAIRMQWKKPVNYHLLSIGTGCYTSALSSSTLGGYCGWIFKQGFLINTLMDATRSFIEIIADNLAKFNGMKRMKLNYQLTKEMGLDDGAFVSEFDQEWLTLRKGGDFQAFVYFYKKYIADASQV